MGYELIYSLLISLAATLVLETAFCFLLFKVKGRDVLLVVLVNVLTNPPVVLTFILLKPHLSFSPWMLAAALELAAVAVEAVFYRLCAKKIKRPFLMSLSANAFSYFTGLIISAII